MLLPLFLTSTFMALGEILCAPFAVKTPLGRRIMKFVVILALTALIAYFAGEFWGIVWAVGWFTLAIVVHLWGCRKLGIHPLTGEPLKKLSAVQSA